MADTRAAYVRDLLARSRFARDCAQIAQFGEHCDTRTREVFTVDRDHLGIMILVQARAWHVSTPCPRSGSGVYDPVMIRIGLIGFGRMGGPICVNLVTAGHPLIVCDADLDRERAALECGATWRSSPSEVAANADVFITVLPGSAEVDAVMSDAVLDALEPGATWIDMSSNSPTPAAVIRERACARGLGVLEAPMGGGPDDADAGTLRLFVGGDSELLAQHRPLLEVIADPNKIVHAGGPGTGYTLKLLVNLLWFGQAVATAEALLLGHRAGIALDVLHDTFAGSAASSEFILRVPTTYATCRYSWSSPPARSRRRTRNSSRSTTLSGRGRIGAA